MNWKAFIYLYVMPKLNLFDISFSVFVQIFAIIDSVDRWIVRESERLRNLAHYKVIGINMILIWYKSGEREKLRLVSMELQQLVERTAYAIVSSFCIYLMKYLIFISEGKQKGENFILNFLWDFLSSDFQSQDFCFCFFFQKLWRSWKLEERHEESKALVAYLLWLYASFVLCYPCWSIHIHFYSLWIRLEWAFYGSQQFLHDSES